MLQTLRKGASSWVAKAFLGLLVISFAVWGIGDMFRGFGVKAVASIGSAEISIESFRQLYNQRIQDIGRQVGRPLTPDQARSFGVDLQLLNELLAESALDQWTARLGLGISDEAVVRRIREGEAFRGPDGAFDRNRFEQLIRSNGYSEAGYIAHERQLAKRQQVARTIGGAIVPPQTMAKLIDTYRNETREVTYVKLDRSVAGDIAAPSDEALKAWFEERKSAFRAPEYRKVVVLALTVESLAPWIEVPDSDIAAFYESHKNSFGSPEQRTIEQITFPTMEEAEAAAAKIAAGTSFADIATERGVKPADLALGTLARDSMLDPTVAAAAFALPEGGVSAAIRGRLANVLMRVTKIIPAQVATLDSMRDRIHRQIALERAKRDILDRHDKVEDERAAGRTLAEVASATGLPLETIDAVDRSGRDPEGSEIRAFPGRNEVLRGAFATDVGVENDPIQLGADGFVWFDVQNVTRARDRTLEEAKDRVLAAWRDEQAAARVKTKADEIVQRVKAGTKLAAVAEAEQFAVSTATVQRAGTKELPPAAVAAVFTTAVGGATSAARDDAVSRVVLQVTDSKLPDSSAEAATVSAELRRGLEDDLIAEHVARLENDLGVKINRSALDQIVGREGGQ